MIKWFSNKLTSKLTRQRIDLFLQKQASDKKTLDIGANRRPYKKYFPNAVTVDIDADFKPDIVADVHDLNMIKDHSFEIVLATEVLEHFYDPWQAIKEICRVLKPHGRLILTTRFVFPLHEVPNDYFRFTKYGLKKIVEPYFDQIEITEEANSVETISILLQRLGFQTEPKGFRFLKIIWHFLSKFFLIFRYINKKEYGDIRMQKPETSILVSGYYVTARKK